MRYFDEIFNICSTGIVNTAVLRIWKGRIGYGWKLVVAIGLDNAKIKMRMGLMDGYDR